MKGIHCRLVDSPHEGPVMQKAFPYYDMLLKWWPFGFSNTVIRDHPFWTTIRKYGMSAVLMVSMRTLYEYFKMRHLMGHVPLMTMLKLLNWYTTVPHKHCPLLKSLRPGDGVMEVDQLWFKLCVGNDVINDSAINSLRLSDAYICHQPRPLLVHIMACHLAGTKPLSEPMLKYC